MNNNFDEVENTEYMTVKMDAKGVSEITKALEYLRIAASQKWTVIGDTSTTKNTYILGSMLTLNNQLRYYNILVIELVKLEMLYNAFNIKYLSKSGQRIEQEDAQELEKLIATTENAWMNLIIKRNFVDSRPNENTVFDYDALYREGISALFLDKSIISHLPHGVVFDLNQSLKCMINDLATPSVMEALRGCEGMLRQVYKITFGKEIQERWFDVADEIFSYYDTLGINVTVLRKYDAALRLTRNSAEHPGTIFVIREAEKTLDDTVQFIYELDKLLPKKASLPTA